MSALRRAMRLSFGRVVVLFGTCLKDSFIAALCSEFCPLTFYGAPEVRSLRKYWKLTIFHVFQEFRVEKQVPPTYKQVL